MKHFTSVFTKDEVPGFKLPDERGADHLLILTQSQEILASDWKNLQELWLIKTQWRCRLRSVDDDDDGVKTVCADTM